MIHSIRSILHSVLYIVIVLLTANHTFAQNGPLLTTKTPPTKWTISLGLNANTDYFHGELYEYDNLHTGSIKRKDYSIKPGINFNAEYALKQNLFLGATIVYRYANDMQKTTELQQKDFKDEEYNTEVKTMRYNISIGPTLTYNFSNSNLKPFIKQAFLISPNYVEYYGNTIFPDLRNSDPTVTYSTMAFTSQTSMGVRYLVNTHVDLFVFYSFSYQKQVMYNMHVLDRASLASFDFEQQYKNKFLTGYLHTISIGLSYILI